ncbi:hypothetical protein K0M31_010884 [Melipona bicolor]|uniref:Uncharacterized protein n=1 Tax=Melipona bicolor TaxID=60889 RepID=A0AA40FL96_9HYME|nr:hypothetical protein K0M31_010884 [Melipona bicolor]
MWANNAHFGSNRDALHFVHYSVHVSMWPGCRGGIPRRRALPTTSQPETTQAFTVHEEGSPAHRPLLKDPEVHSSKFATRQVASSRMALPASSSGDEVEGSSSGRQRGLVNCPFPPPPFDDTGQAITIANSHYFPTTGAFSSMSSSREVPFLQPWCTKNCERRIDRTGSAISSGSGEPNSRAYQNRFVPAEHWLYSILRGELHTKPLSTRGPRV